MHDRMKVLILIVIFFVMYSPRIVEAHQYKQAVLGDSVKASDVFIQPVAAGPGMLLPDSPFYFIDKGVQNIRLFLAFSSEQKAQVHESVAQERLAELRVMMAKNDSEGIVKALTELTRENAAAASELKAASAEGKDVKKLAVKLNETMKLQREILTSSSDQAKGSLKLQLKAAKAELKIAIVEVEDELPDDELLKEVEETITQDIEDEIGDASESAKGLEHSVDLLTKLASEAGKKQQDKREEALRKAIEVKNATLRRKQELLIQKEKQKQEKLMQMKMEAAGKAKETVKNAQETAKKFEEAKQAMEEARKEQLKDESDDGNETSPEKSTTSSGDDDATNE